MIRITVPVGIIEEEETQLKDSGTEIARSEKNGARSENKEGAYDEKNKQKVVQASKKKRTKKIWQLELVKVSSHTRGIRHVKGLFFRFDGKRERQIGKGGLSDVFFFFVRQSGVGNGHLFLYSCVYFIPSHSPRGAYTSENQKKKPNKQGCQRRTMMTGFTWGG